MKGRLSRANTLPHSSNPRFNRGRTLPMTLSGCVTQHFAAALMHSADSAQLAPLRWSKDEGTD
jgi:hypothetical protein